VAGDVLGSGTVGTGCILEHGDGRWLRAGDVVELEIEGIGVLRNRVVAGAGASAVESSQSRHDS
jgi:2-keto-4-pentenoate hydratase/2-oxohepta-3-ene-1,7-dioic acid hydratase in catechol pathway